jgi:antitoxin CptB
MAIPAVEMRRLRWRCRRGLLENDLVLARFLERYADLLGETQLAALNDLLALPDPDLWDLISGRREPADPRLKGILGALRED